jgi:hypothetical protein
VTHGPRLCEAPAQQGITRPRLRSGCWRRIRSRAAAERLAPALAIFTARQVGQAHELIEDAALIPVDGGLFLAVSTDGTEVYEVTAEACSCPASRECYHQAAVIMLGAPRATARRSSLAEAA